MLDSERLTCKQAISSIENKALLSTFQEQPKLNALWCRDRVPDTTSVNEGSSASIEHTLVEYGHWILSLGVMYAGNKAIAQATAAAGISFPSPLIGTPYA